MWSKTALPRLNLRQRWQSLTRIWAALRNEKARIYIGLPTTLRQRGWQTPWKRSPRILANRKNALIFEFDRSRGLKLADRRKLPLLCRKLTTGQRLYSTSQSAVPRCKYNTTNGAIYWITFIKNTWDLSLTLMLAIHTIMVYLSVYKVIKQQLLKKKLWT